MRTKGHRTVNATSGVYGNITIMSCCSRYSPSTLPLDHSRLWFENRIGARLRHDTGWLESGDYIDGSFRSEHILPHHFAVHHREKAPLPLGSGRPDNALMIDPVSRRLSAMRYYVRGLDATSPLEQNFLCKLPTELLMQIIAPLVATDRIFHFSPYSFGRGARRVISVHQICPVQEDEISQTPVITLLPIALTCQRLKDVTYAIFYGRNQFVIEAATVGLTSHVSVPPYVPMGYSSWNRIHTPGTSGITEPISPLTQTVMAHVTDLTICITLSRRGGTTADQRTLRGYLQKLAECFKDAQTHSLRRLAVGVTVATRTPHRYYSKQLRLSGTSRVRMELLRCLPAPDSACKRKAVAPVDYFAEPLCKIRGNVQISVGGLLEHRFEDRLRSSVLGQTDAVEDADSADELPASKRICR